MTALETLLERLIDFKNYLYSDTEQAAAILESSEEVNMVTERWVEPTFLT